MATHDAYLPPADDRFLEDYVVGSVWEYGSIKVEQDEVIAFAQRFDPQRIHTDPDFAASGQFGGLIASGMHSASFALRLYVEHHLSHVASLASPGIDELRWKLPVRPGDILSIRVTTLDKVESRSRPDRGMIKCLIETLNQHGQLVTSFIVMSFIGKRSHYSARS